MVLKKLEKFSGYYVAAHGQRLKLTHLKWRTIWILMAVLAVLMVNDYLQFNYSVVVEANGKARYLPETLFNWFMTGVAFGIIALAVMYEGEFILSLRRLSREVEGKVKEKIAALPKKQGKPSLAGKKKKA